MNQTKFISNLFIVFTLYFLSNNLQAQIAINPSGNPPDPSAGLDINYADKGILIPRVALDNTTSATPISSPATSLLIYNTATVNDVSPGYYYWNGSKWTKLLNIGSDNGVYWSLSGNSGTVDGTNFIGTKDNVAINFKVNNIKSGRIGTNADASVFLGYGAGENDDLSDNQNTFIGFESGNSNTTGSYNTAIGYQTFYSNTSGNYNVASGYQSLFSNTTGENNTATGAQAMFSNTSGGANTSLGTQALYSNTTGNNNTATGMQAMYSNTTGDNNTATGMQALYSNTTGNSNTAMGVQALYSNTSGGANTAMGMQALYSNTSGASNTAIGYQSMYSNATGNYNTAIGTSALLNNLDGESNVAIGVESLFSNTSGSSNTAMGLSALYSNTTGGYNVAIGKEALYSNTTGIYNTSIGYQSLKNNNTASYNTAIGSEALLSNTTGDLNTAVGEKSLYSNTTGGHNAALGKNSLYSNTTGSYNTALGYEAFLNGTNYTNSTAVGYQANITASNQVRIGNTAVSDIGGYANWTNLSDARFKTQITENIPGLALLMELHPVTYQLDIKKLNKFLKIDTKESDNTSIQKKEEEIQIGFLAQEVEKAAEKLNFDFHAVKKPQNENDTYGLRYAEFVPILTKALQEQQQIIKQLIEKNKKRQEEIDELKKILKAKNK